ncbi:hypothetical protein BV898_10927 [Hypsibius exemplaris]|uniref:Uncharacterized protein n=1 Tax=Hypsibius exemplaris TaxID=2072580 RepID=A0A1W0WI56_HYPEX|nr:hypothetical protein BV898_10927 [Hypsibius exemplaris]
MATSEDPMAKISPQHQDIVNSTWSQLLNAEGGVQNLAADLLKGFAAQSGNSGKCGQAGGSGQLLSQLGGLAGFLGGGGSTDLDNLHKMRKHTTSRAFLNNRNNQGTQNSQGDQRGDDQQESNSRFGGGNFLDQFGGLDNIAGMVTRGLNNQGGGGNGGAGGLMQSLGGLGSLAALAGINLNDPSSLLKFFRKTPVAAEAANPDNSSRDIYKTIKNVIFELLGSKLPAEDFQQNPENKSAWKGYLGAIANALRNSA